MSADPVMLDIARYLDGKSDAERMEETASNIKQAYTKAEAKEIIDDHFGATGGDDLTELLGALVAAESGLPRSIAIARLSDRLDEILMDAAIITAEQRAEGYDP